MVWLPDGEKISKISLFVLTQLTNMTDTQTNRHTHTQTQTPHDGIGRAYASHRAAKGRFFHGSFSFVIIYVLALCKTDTIVSYQYVGTVGYRLLPGLSVLSNLSF